MAGVSDTVAAVRLSSNDNVATLLAAAGPAATITVRSIDGAGQAIQLTLSGAVPAGHKIALEDIPAAGDVRKYGMPIARASAPIRRGEHVHVHNSVSSLSPRKGGQQAPAKPVSIAADKLKAFVLDCLRAADIPDQAAQPMADHLVEAHLRGVETHGLRRLKPYLVRLRAGGVDAGAEPQIETSGSVLRVDGRNGIGHHVAAVAAEAVAKAAREHGAAVALIRNSNHFGFAGYYATRIASCGMASVVTSNGQVLVGPEGAKRAIFSNDPIAVAAPLPDGTFFEFDMATSVTSRANIVQAAALDERIAPGVALDAEGNPTTNAKAAATGILLPFGGNKGFALIAAIELLTGILTGGAYADLVASKEADAEAPEGTAHFMLAIDLDAALGRSLFEQRLADMAQRMAALPMRVGDPPPRSPGARRWALRRERLAQGIPLSASDATALRTLAEEYDLALGL